MTPNEQANHEPADYRTILLGLIASLTVAETGGDIQESLEYALGLIGIVGPWEDRGAIYDTLSRMGVKSLWGGDLVAPDDDDEDEDDG